MISLKVEKLTKKFNQHTIFSELSFEHENGILGISGANGSGKSTLLKCLAYLLRANSGTIAWRSNSTHLNRQALKNHIGYAAPYINLYAELTVAENLLFLMELSGSSASETDLHQLLNKTHIPHLEQQLFGSLSTGQQQRVKLAAALARNPQVLMLDEPGSNLDEKGHALVTEIVETAAASGKLVFLASNDPSEIALCDTVIAL